MVQPANLTQTRKTAMEIKANVIVVLTNISDGIRVNEEISLFGELWCNGGWLVTEWRRSDPPQVNHIAIGDTSDGQPVGLNIGWMAIQHCVAAIFFVAHGFFKPCVHGCSRRCFHFF
jgi:hypothetical protein